MIDESDFSDVELDDVDATDEGYMDALYEFHHGTHTEVEGETSVIMDDVPDMDTGYPDVDETIEWFTDGSDIFYRLTSDIGDIPLKIQRVKVLNTWHRPDRM